MHAGRLGRASAYLRPKLGWLVERQRAWMRLRHVSVHLPASDEQFALVGQPCQRTLTKRCFRLTIAAGALTVTAVTPSLLRGQAAGPAQPTVTLIPDHASCDHPLPVLGVRGEGFPSNVAVIMSVAAPRPDGTIGSTALGVGFGAVDASGALTGAVDIGLCDAKTEDGLEFGVSIYEGTTPNIGPHLADATFTVAQSASPAPGGTEIPSTPSPGSTATTTPMSEAGAANRTLQLIPDHGTCDPPVLALGVRGVGYPPSIAVNMYVGARYPDNSVGALGGGSGFGSVNADGELSGVVRLRSCDPATVDGVRFTVGIYEGTRPVVGLHLADGAFTVARSATPAAAEVKSSAPLAAEAAARSAGLPAAGTGHAAPTRVLLVTALLGAAALLGGTALVVAYFGRKR